MTFRVGVGRDVRKDDRAAVHDLRLELLDAEPGVEWEFLAAHALELAPETVRGFDAIMLWEPGGVSAATLAGADRLQLIARFGMGLEAIDLDACARRGVMVTTAPDAVRTAVPSGAMAFVLALAHRIVEKNALVHRGRWDDRFDYVGLGTTGRVLGVIGLGNVGRGVVRMAEGFGFRRLAFDPYADPATVPDGVELVDLETLLATSDFACVTCPLTPDTHHLLDAERLALMRPDAYVINVARGPIVDTLALAAAIGDGRLGGAGLDVTENEPIEPDHPLLSLGDRVLINPHAVAYTQAAFQSLGASACAAVLAAARGEIPEHVANPAALDHRRTPRAATG
jgi:phosphoglycerate dehydrogenase-like enzyme